MPEKLKIDLDWSAQKPFNFFGPCSAESSAQVLQTAKGIAEENKKAIFRAGIWKPRTRPNTFEGVGEEGLDWLIEVKKQFGLQIATEVANAKHVESCLQKGIDVLWIGARTTVNPFSVQEIAEALKGSNVQVFVKNPIHADLGLWIGALERVNQAGITKLGAIHRGFHEIESLPYRNSPKWNVVMELKRTFSNLPIVCDASHISGKPSLIPIVAQKAIDLSMDGLMIETHCSPQDALSDATQQIQPQELIKIINGLEYRISSSDNIEFKNALLELRNGIDKIDDQLVELLAKRMEVIKQIGQYKKDNNVTIFQLKRWNEILKRTNLTAKTLELNEIFIEKIYNDIHEESIRQQTAIMNPKKD